LYRPHKDVKVKRKRKKDSGVILGVISGSFRTVPHYFFAMTMAAFIKVTAFMVSRVATRAVLRLAVHIGSIQGPLGVCAKMLNPVKSLSLLNWHTLKFFATFRPPLPGLKFCRF
jgi:hypothetical protein